MRMKLLTGLALSACLAGTACLATDRPMNRSGAASADAATPSASSKPTTTTATSDTDLVVSGPAEQSDVTVYGGAFAQVQENRTVTLKAGHNRIQLNGIAARYRPDSLRLVDTKGPGAFAYRSATYQPANLTNERLLVESIGKQVKAWRWTDKGVREVVGTLQSVSGAALVLSVGSGQTELLNTGEVTLLETPTGLSNTPALVVEADVTASGDYNVEFLYETEGITWTAKHSLIFDEDNSKVSSWEATVSLTNDSGTSLKNATLRLLSGRVAAAAADGPGGMYAPQMRAASVQSESASVENVGDQKVYTIPGTVNLAAGQTRQIPLFNGKDVPVKRQYIVGTPTGYSATGKYDAQIRLTVENCEKHNLGKPIPAGLVKVYQYNSAKKLQLTGSTRLSEKAQDEIFDLNVGTSSDVKWELKLASATAVVDLSNDNPNPKPTPRPNGGPARVISDPTSPQAVAPQGEKEEYEDRTYEVVVYNYKRDKDVTVKVEVNVPAKQQLEPKWKRLRADRAETDLSVPKSGQTSVKYTIRTRTR